jgi:protein phosphatase
MDLKLAPFHLLATEGRVHVDKDHVWHMTTLARLCSADAALLLATPYKVVDVTDDAMAPSTPHRRIWKGCDHGGCLRSAP